jgi:hypothetical protein
MKNVIHTLALAAVLGFGSEKTRAAPSDEPTVGKVLVLDNEHTLEGDIERVGSQYRVRRVIGETWVSGDRVLRLCSDVASAYVFLRSRANLNDADERLRLAEWCRQHSLRTQALAEVQEAVRIRPQHGPSRRLLEHLQQEPPLSDVAAKQAPDSDLPVVQVDLSADAVGLFATRVQPILMNTCAGCHASEKSGKFKLTRCYESEGTNRRITHQNLAAVLAQVNLREPRISPLLTKSVSVHGPLAQAPLKNRQAPAYRTLEEWVRLTLASNPGLHDSSPGSASEARSADPAKKDAGFASDVVKPADGAATMPASADGSPAKAPAPDPFDPAIFNRQAHPETAPMPPKKS